MKKTTEYDEQTIPLGIDRLRRNLSQPRNKGFRIQTYEPKRTVLCIINLDKQQKEYNKDITEGVKSINQKID